jgi:hypothetical protein
MTVNTTVEVLTGLAGTGVGAVIHRFWQDAVEYLADHKPEVNRAVDQIVDRGIDVLAEVPASPRDSSNVDESVKTASVPATGEEV